MSDWYAAERAGLGNTAGYVQKLISVAFDKKNPGEGSFDLYYFVPNFPLSKTKKPEERKTLLFCSGGPGRVIKPHDSLWFKDLSLNGDNIVFFHLRGSGFSQLPQSNSYDKYIRTRYAVDDIEAIRNDLFKDSQDKPWDAVIGYSYGAVLAQQYASKYGDSLRKLVLIAPISLENFNSSKNYRQAYNNYLGAAHKVCATVIEKIYQLAAFEQMTNQQKRTIAEHLLGNMHLKDLAGVGFAELGIIRAVEKSFGTEENVIDNYDFLKAKSVLKNNHLDYELRFFEALRELQLYGWRKDNDGAVNQEDKLTKIGEVIARNLLKHKSTASFKGTQPEGATANTNAPRSKRVFEVMGVYDGTNKRFIREWDANKPNTFVDAVKAASGSALSELSEEIHIAEKIGIEREEIPGIKPWTPKDHGHNKSTLILAGTADPVIAGNQANTFLGKHLVGQKSILLEFDGVGHEFLVPAVKINSPAVSPELRGINADTLNSLIDAFVKKPFDVFYEAAKTIADRLSTEEQMRVDREGPA